KAANRARAARELRVHLRWVEPRCESLLCIRNLASNGIGSCQLSVKRLGAVVADSRCSGRKVMELAACGWARQGPGGRRRIDRERQGRPCVVDGEHMTTRLVVDDDQSLWA